jgi:hypothetical protein
MNFFWEWLVKADFIFLPLQHQNGKRLGVLQLGKRFGSSVG